MRTDELVPASVTRSVPGRKLQTWVLAITVLFCAVTTMPFNSAFLVVPLVALGLPRVDSRLRLLVSILAILAVVMGLLLVTGSDGQVTTVH